MDVNLGNALRKFIVSKKYLEKYNSNVYTHTCVIIRDGKIRIQTNAGLDKKAVSVINNFINKSEFENWAGLRKPMYLKLDAIPSYRIVT